MQRADQVDAVAVGQADIDERQREGLFGNQRMGLRDVAPEQQCVAGVAL